MKPVIKFYPHIPKNFGLTAAESFLLCIILSYQESDEICMETLDELAQDMNVSRVTVIKAIKNLKKKNLITVTKIQNRNSYEANVHMIFNIDN